MDINTIHWLVAQLVELPFTVEFHEEFKEWNIIENVNPEGKQYVLSFWLINSKKLEFKAPHYGDVGWWLMFRIQYFATQMFGGIVDDDGVGKYTPKPIGSYRQYLKSVYKQPMLKLLCSALQPAKYKQLGRHDPIVK